MTELKTRSVNAPRDVLGELFGTTEEEVGTFLDVIMDRIGKNQGADSMSLARRLVSGEPDLVKAPKKLMESISGFVRIFHGWHNKDYVWHIEHAAIRRPWKVSVDRVIYIVAKIMHDALPDVEASIWRPHLDWELKTITFKALGLADAWSFNEEDVSVINQRIFESLNQVV